MLDKVSIDTFKNLSKNEKPATAKDLNNIFNRFDNKNNSSMISKGPSPPKTNMKQHPPLSAKKVVSQSSVNSQRSLSKGRRGSQQHN